MSPSTATGASQNESSYARVFSEKLAAYIESLQPANAVELDLVENMAAAQTKMRLAGRHEGDLDPKLERGHKDAEKSFHRALNALMALRRYERVEHEAAYKEDIRRGKREEMVKEQVEEIRRSTGKQVPSGIVETVMSTFPKPAHLLRYEAKARAKPPYTTATSCHAPNTTLSAPQISPTVA